MNRLKGQNILIGKEPNIGRLLVCVNLNGKTLTGLIGQPGIVPNSVSRCKPSEQTAHCRIDIDMTGSMILTNLKPQNITYVDGVQIMSKHINNNSIVSLGKDHFVIDINVILKVALQMVESVLPPPPVEYSIAHLESVWIEYEQAIENIQRRQQNKSKRRMLPIMFGSVSSIAAPLFATFVSSSTLFLTVPIAAVSLFMYIVIYNEKDTSIEEKKNATDCLMDHYVCPNPACKHFLGVQPYKVLRQNKKCPYCGCHIKV